MPRVTETFMSGSNVLTFASNSILFNILEMENMNLTHDNLNTCIYQPENWWILHRVSHCTLTSRIIVWRKGQLWYCTSSFKIGDESHQYKNKTRIGCQIRIKLSIGLKCQVTANKKLCSLFGCKYGTVWLFSAAPGNGEDDTVMEKKCTEALYSAMKSLVHAIQTEDTAAQQDTAHYMIPFANSLMRRRRLESTLRIGKSLHMISKKIVYLLDLERTKKDQA